MSIVHECSAKNCKTLTMGQFCVEHEQTTVFDHSSTDALLGRVTHRNTTRALYSSAASR